MDRRQHYEACIQLPTEDADLHDQPVSPPEYGYLPSTAPVTTSLFIPPSCTTVRLVDEESQSVPPPYSDTMDLPTYAECMRAKLIEDAERQDDTPAIISRQETTAEGNPETRQKFENVVGTDAMFILGFILAFLFNWIGLLTAFCLMHTCAGRFGALTGFGLSFVKWVTIAERNWMGGMSDENAWIWWLLLSFGILVSCSGALQYLRLKYVWSRAQSSDTFINRLM